MDPLKMHQVNWVNLPPAFLLSASVPGVIDAYIHT